MDGIGAGWNGSGVISVKRVVTSPGVEMTSRTKINFAVGLHFTLVCDLAMLGFYLVRVELEHQGCSRVIVRLWTNLSVGRGLEDFGGDARDLKGERGGVAAVKILVHEVDSDGVNATHIRIRRFDRKLPVLAVKCIVPGRVSGVGNRASIAILRRYHERFKRYDKRRVINLVDLICNLRWNNELWWVTVIDELDSEVFGCSWCSLVISERYLELEVPGGHHGGICRMHVKCASFQVVTNWVIWRAAKFKLSRV